MLKCKMLTASSKENFKKNQLNVCLIKNYFLISHSQKNSALNYSEKQIQIIEEAESLFAEKGYNGTSVREIAAKADVNVAMISYYFGSKDKLLEAIFKYRGETSKMSLEELLKNPDLTSHEKINKLIENYVTKVMDQQPFYKIMSREMVVSNSKTTESLIIEIKKSNLDIISRIILQGQKDGSFLKDIDIPMMISTLSGSANNLISTQKYYRTLSGLNDMSDEDFQKHLKKKLTANLKRIFKILLSDEM